MNRKTYEALAGRPLEQVTYLVQHCDYADGMQLDVRRFAAACAADLGRAKAESKLTGRALVRREAIPATVAKKFPALAAWASLEAVALAEAKAREACAQWRADDDDGALCSPDDGQA